MDIRAFKLTTGEEIVTEIVTEIEKSENTSGYNLKKPRVLLMSPGKDPDQMHVTLVPWMTSAQNPTTGSEQNIVLHTHSIVAELSDVPSALEKGYIANTSAIQMIT